MFKFLTSDPRTALSYVLSFPVAIVFAYYAARLELRRRKLIVRPAIVVVVASVCGFVGAQIFGRLGFAYDGAFLAGLAGMAVLAKFYRVPILILLDAACSAAALAYGLFRVGDLFRRNREYVSAARALHLQLRPVHEFVAAIIIFWVLWKLGTISLRKPMPDGQIFATYLACFGAARFAINYYNAEQHALRLIPSQVASLACLCAGIILFAAVKIPFHRVDKHHRILQHSVRIGDVLQPESKAPTPECPHPERWSMYDAMTAEVEVLEFLKTMVTTLKPSIVVETGTFMGVSTLQIAEGLKQNGFGRVISCEPDPKTFETAKKRFQDSGLSQWIDLRNQSSLDLKVNETIDLLFTDSELALREQEVRRFLPQMTANGVILMHDASSHLHIVRDAALRMEREGLISVVLIPTPRGLVVAQKREGRA
jgi:predicted O-methyltransferase YrrM/prolipoprotein diacylglyceryltransferase